jgi:hypothetical protein
VSVFSTGITASNAGDVIRPTPNCPTKYVDGPNPDCHPRHACLSTGWQSSITRCRFLRPCLVFNSVFRFALVRAQHSRKPGRDGDLQTYSDFRLDNAAIRRASSSAPLSAHSSPITNHRDRPPTTSGTDDEHGVAGHYHLLGAYCVPASGMGPTFRYGRITLCSGPIKCGHDA